MTVTPPAEIRTAIPELVALATAVRPDWAAADVQAAIVDAKTCGWTWAQALVGMARLIVDLDARPGELVPPNPDPQRSKAPQKPGRPADHADDLAAARAAAAAAAEKLRSLEQARRMA
ncbi:hypothetical protein ACFYOK_10800 [Microbispora bryophytorum]|uniref:hypothetical protein n=1 Tax=Microbispora bryophytorum TaxID=1460882 RepID=UPI0033F3A60F